MTLRLGKNPATKDARDLLFRDYATTAKLPKPPAIFGHDYLIPPKAWGMLGNDDAGDCVFAGAAHETMLWKAEVKQYVEFSSASVLSDYSAVTGYDPSDPSSDVGTDVREALRYRRMVGVKDARGIRHKIGAYVSLDPGNITQLWQALYLFGAVGIGFNFPASAMDQFNLGQKWTYVRGSHIEGGHYVPVVARRGGINFITWGQETAMTKEFYTQYNDEAWAILSAEAIVNGKSPEGFDLATLRADLALL